MSNDNSGYRPSPGERLAQDFAAKKLGEVLNGHGTTVPVDWDRIVGNLGDSAERGDSSGTTAEAIPVEAILFLCDYGIPLGATTSDWLLNRTKVICWLKEVGR